MNFTINQTSASLRGPGGKACATCVRVKSKCVSRLDGATCERCHRLNKPCVPSTPAKRRGPKPNNVSYSNPMPMRLEKKLDDLMSLIRVQQTPAGQARDSNDHLGSDRTDDNSNETSPTLTDDASPGLLSDTYNDEPTAQEAEARLRCFREEMVPLCPYVHIAPDVDAKTLRQHCPFLWLNIMSVTSVPTETRHSLGRQIKNIIVHKIVAGGERSVDMLLGVLTFLCWIHLFPMDKLFASMVSQIAVCLIYDNGLHMAPPEQPSKIGPLLKSKGFSCLPQVRKDRTMDDRRAVLGTYMITSTTCHAFRSADGLPWSNYLDECLDYITQNSTEPQDHVLVAQVRLQVMVNQLRSTYRGGGNIQVPIAYLDALRSQLETILTPVSGVSSVFENDSMMRLYHCTMLMIHESLKTKPPLLHDQDMKHFKACQRVVDSIRSWLDLYFAIPLENLPFLPCGNYSQLYYVTVYIYRISSVRSPTWNALLTEATVELAQTLDKVVERFEQASSLTPEAGDAFLLGIHKFGALRTAWQNEPAAHDLNAGGDDLPVLQEDAMMGESGTDFSSFLLDSTLVPGLFDDLIWQ